MKMKSLESQASKKTKAKKKTKKPPAAAAAGAASRSSPWLQQQLEERSALSCAKSERRRLVRVQDALKEGFVWCVFLFHSWFEVFACVESFQIRLSFQ